MQSGRVFMDVLCLYMLINLYWLALNPNIASDGQSYFHFNCLILHLSGTVLSLLVP
jgi:hypothetical protein